jgi:hypothetical protein
MHTAEDHVQLIGFPAVGDGQHDIIFGHDAQIAMHSFHRMEENCMGAGAGEGGYNFFADQSGFTDPGHDHTAFGFVNDVDSPDKIITDLIDKLKNGFSLYFQDIAGLFDRRVFFHVPPFHLVSF